MIFFSFRKAYNIDIRSINYGKFFEDAVIGVRRYLNKESDDTLEEARKKVKIFYVLNCLVQIIFLFGIWWIIASIFRVKLTSCVWALFAAYFLFSFL